MSDFDRYKVMKAKRMVSATETRITSFRRVLLLDQQNNLSLILVVDFKQSKGQIFSQRTCECQLYSPC